MTAQKSFRIPALQAVRYELASRTFKEFFKQAWEVLEPGTPLVWNWHLDVLCDHLELVTVGEVKNLIINIPPGHAKSWLVSVAWPAWQWLHRPSFRMIAASYNMDLSNRDNQRSRQLITSPWYEGLKRHMGLDWEMKGDQNVKSFFANTAMGERLAVAAKGKITGFRGDAIVVDDPHLIKTVPKIEDFLDVAEWYDKVLSTRLNDQDTAIRILIMQRVHTADLTGHLLEKHEGKYIHLSLPTEYEPDHEITTPYFTDPRTEPGELLFPGKFSATVIEHLKESLGPQEFAAQFQQHPVAMAGGHFNGGTLQFWYPPGFDPEPVQMLDAETEEVVECPQICIEMDQLKDFNASWDLAFQGTVSSDFVVGQVWARRKEASAHLVLVDQSRGRWTFGKTCDRIQAQQEKWPRLGRVYVEDAANGAAVIDTLQGEIPGLLPVKPQGGKVSRANAVLPQFEAGQVWLPHPEVYPWVTGLLDELLKFPKAKHDDQVDALTQALAKLRKRVSIIF